MKVVIGCDKLGCALSQRVGELLTTGGHEVVDLGPPGFYYDVAVKAARMVASGEADRAILSCGSGMGMGIMANKVRGVYAAVCESAEAARNSRRINNANVLALGGNVTAPDQAAPLVEAFMGTAFLDGFEGETREWLQQSMAELDGLEAQEFAAAK